MKAADKAVPDKCFECPRPWAAVSIRSFGAIYRCMPCWARAYILASRPAPPLADRAPNSADSLHV